MAGLFNPKLRSALVSNTTPWGEVFPAKPNPQTLAYDGRTAALRVLREYVTGLTFLRAGSKGGPPIPFQIKPENFLVEWPDHEFDFVMPSAVVVPKRADYDVIGLTAYLEEDTKDVYAPGTVLQWQCEYVETMNIEVWGARKSERRAMMAGLDIAFSPTEQMSGVRFQMKEYFNELVCFTANRREIMDEDASAPKNRRRGQIEIEMRFNIVALVNYTNLNPIVAALTQLEFTPPPLTPAPPWEAIYFDFGLAEDDVAMADSVVESVAYERDPAEDDVADTDATVVIVAGTFEVSASDTVFVTDTVVEDEQVTIAVSVSDAMGAITDVLVAQEEDMLNVQNWRPPNHVGAKTLNNDFTGVDHFSAAAWQAPAQQWLVAGYNTALVDSDSANALVVSSYQGEQLAVALGSFPAIPSGSTNFWVISSLIADPTDPNVALAFVSSQANAGDGPTMLYRLDLGSSSNWVHQPSADTTATTTYPQYFNGRFVVSCVEFALPFTTTIISSTDGITWTANLSITSGSQLIVGNSKLIQFLFGTSNNNYYQSTDGTTWTLESFTGVTLASGDIAQAGAYGETPSGVNRFLVAISHTVSEGNYFIYSDDNGATWNLGSTLALGGTSNIVSMSYSNGIFVATVQNFSGNVNATSVIYSVDGGITWLFAYETGVNLPANEVNFDVVAFCNGNGVGFLTGGSLHFQLSAQSGPNAVQT